MLGYLRSTNLQKHRTTSWLRLTRVPWAQKIRPRKVEQIGEQELVMDCPCQTCLLAQVLREVERKKELNSLYQRNLAWRRPELETAELMRWKEMTGLALFGLDSTLVRLQSRQSHLLDCHQLFVFPYQDRHTIQAGYRCCGLWSRRSYCWRRSSRWFIVIEIKQIHLLDRLLWRRSRTSR